MATLEEQHFTRGRARMLWEALQGDLLSGGWRNDEVKESLDLCLACKGCKSDCPVNVDMATYKAEYLAHYYRGRLRPRQAYTMGLIHWWARLGSLLPSVANGVANGPGASRLTKKMLGVSQERTLPRFAPRTFKRWFRSYDPWNKKGPPVVLWPDTFNDHFHPEALRAAATVLEAAGYRVVVPRQSLCCGRPLYDFGMLALAKRLLRQVMDVLGPEIDAGVPIVGIEPSCAAVFRDELLGLFPDVERARRLSAQVFTFAEFLGGAAADLGDTYAAPGFGGLSLVPLEGPAMIHLHCHHKAVLGTGADERLLRALGLQTRVLDAGCCGMAGPFGFDTHHFEVSRECGEKVLLPEVRGAAEDCLIVADGFSCREQIAQLGDRQALHLAQVVALALHGTPGAGGAPGDEGA
jgi:Fe-S oxidoreductase